MSPALTIRHAPHPHPLVRKASSELARFLSRQSGLPVRCEAAHGAACTIQVAAGASGRRTAASIGQVRADGYLIQPVPDGFLLAARTPKGLLNAVYGYLSWAGVQWPTPGVELLPDQPRLAWPREPLLRNPAFARRGIVHAISPDAWPDCCEWYARLGFNEIFTHGSGEQWQAMQKTAEDFGIAMQTGGHGLASLLPRSQFEKHPEYFRELQPPDFDPKRMPDANLCAANPDALAIVERGARRYVKQFPGASVYHLWADDLPGGGWCACSRCMGLTPQDQAMLAVNALARGIIAADPKAEAAHCIYHDTLPAPRIVKPHPSVRPLFAPRERCYAHALNDPSCERNRHFVESLEGVLAWFGHREWQTFEYYSDYILFRAMLPLIPEVVAGDLRYYKAQGLDNAQHLLVGTVVGLLTNLHVFARQVWDLDADPWAPLRKLARPVPGLLEAWELQAKASLEWLDISDWPLERYFDYRFLLERPPRASRAYRAGVRRAASMLDRAAARLPARLPKWAAREKLSLRTSAGICRQMDSQMGMLEAMGQCHAGADRHAEATRQFRRAVRHGNSVASMFRRAGMDKAYFFGLEKLLESIWSEKVGKRIPEGRRRT